MGTGRQIDLKERSQSNYWWDEILSEKILFFTPGPTYVHPRILRALSKPVEPHSYRGFIERYKATLKKLKALFKTEGEVFLFAGSGTLAQEVMVSNVVKPGDKVLCLVSGFFSSRFKDMILRVKGLPKVIERLNGRGFTGKDVEKFIKRRSFKAITIAHVETSTGVASHIDEIGEVASKYGVKLLVDAVASLGAMDLKVDEWGVTICGSCSQKGIGAPPGCALIATNKQFVEELEKQDHDAPTFYGDLKMWLKVVRDPENYHSTQPVSLVYAIDEALNMIFEERLENRFKRHEIVAEAIRAAIKAAGLRMFAKRGFEANTVTVVHKPEGLDSFKLRSEIEHLGVAIARGSGPLRHTTFRIGHMGWITSSDVLALVASLQLSLQRMGYKPKRNMVKAALNVLASLT